MSFWRRPTPIRSTLAAPPTRSPSSAPSTSGEAQYYLLSGHDKTGKPLDGKTIYRLRVPGERAGHPILVGDRLRPRDACLHPERRAGSAAPRRLRGCKRTRTVRRTSSSVRLLRRARNRTGSRPTRTAASRCSRDSTVRRSRCSTRRGSCPTSRKTRWLDLKGRPRWTSNRSRPSPLWQRAMPPGPDARVKITEEYASMSRATPSSGRGRWSTSTTSDWAPSNRKSSPTPDRCRPRRSIGIVHAHRLRRRRGTHRRLPEPGRGVRRRLARRSTQSPVVSRCPTSATASGSIRSSICAPTASSASARCTAPRRASICLSGRTGRARCPKGITRGLSMLDQHRVHRAAHLHGRHGRGSTGDPAAAAADHDVPAGGVRRHR